MLNIPAMLTVRVLTLFPEMFPGPLGQSLSGKALEKGLWELQTVNIRDFGEGVHKSVDDTPFGGGAGMVMRPDVLGRALESCAPLGRFVYLSPRGRVFDQALAQELSGESRITMLCGRYEGVDQRLLEAYGAEEISIGDYVLSGGELAAQVVMDACVRLLPGVMGNAETAGEESFSAGLLEYPHYTRPALWEGREVPEILLSGHHENIRKWRLEQAEELTAQNRPDLWEKYPEKAK